MRCFKGDNAACMRAGPTHIDIATRGDARAGAIAGAVLGSSRWPENPARDEPGSQPDLRTMPVLADVLCLPVHVSSGSDAVDQLVAAHVNALIACNHAAHHDDLDNELI